MTMIAPDASSTAGKGGLVKSDSPNTIAPLNSTNATDSEIAVEDAARRKLTSNSETLYHVVCIVVGTGILQISTAISETGYVGVLALIFSAFVVDYTGKMLVKCLYVRGERIEGGYPEIGRLAFGAAGEYTVQFFYNLILLGTTCLYLVLSGENFSTVWPALDKQQWILVSAAALYIPFIAMRTLKDIAIISLFGAFASIVVAVIVWVLGLMDVEKTWGTVSHTAFKPSTFSTGFGTFSFSLSANFLYPEIERTMATPKSFPKVISLSMVIIASLYTLTGIIGYVTYGDSVHSPILQDLPKGIATTAATIIITVHSLLACPLLITTFSCVMERWLQIDAPKDTMRQWSMRAVLRTIIILFITMVAYFLPYFKELLSFLGSAADTLLIYFFPIVFYYKINGISGRSYLELAFGLLLVMIGILCGANGAINSVQELIENVRADIVKS